ncbi:chemotaxis protein CheW [Schnuerera sp. xch1]|uniref:chemotaxis protein CheW n=1 Tax=Schnuerera sp. xch1 TaxID=2874283 RepID=UPI001CBD277A|nr:chemotaxis protein CheW [Schnuerera sp. xch1]MBZ2174097.1 chemotaxis protein CheW [Schnuerera sp. xch1]
MSEKQYVVFNLGKEEFGIDIMKVKEIIPYKESTNVPKTPDFIDGIINYRGGVIPIINLKKRFDMNTTEITKETRIIVINLEDKEIGFVVDQASQTIRLNDDNIEPAPGVISQIDKRFITAIGKIDEERLLILLNLHNVLTDKEKSKIREMEM